MDDRPLRERAATTRWEGPVHDLEEPMWTARDPATDCAGIGRVEAEAYGNLAAAVRRYEEEGSSTGYTKYPGPLRRRPATDGGDGRSGWLERLARAFRRGRD